jgi:hypothetical protein
MSLKIELSPFKKSQEMNKNKNLDFNYVLLHQFLSKKSSLIR